MKTKSNMTVKQQRLKRLVEIYQNYVNKYGSSLHNFFIKQLNYYKKELKELSIQSKGKMK